MDEKISISSLLFLVLASGIRKVGLLFSYTVSSNFDVSSIAQFGVQMFQSEYSRVGS